MTPISKMSHLLVVVCLSGLTAACDKSEAQDKEEHHEEHHTIVVTSPVAKDVVSTRQYVCQIHSRRHIEVRALERGYLEGVHVREGQTVKSGDVMFKIVPVLYQATLDTEVAEAELAQIKFDNTERLADQSVVSPQELALAKAELARANAKVKRAQAELSFTALRAPFDGIIDRQHEQQGSLVDEGDILTTVSDNQVMWAYFNVPEAAYLQYMASSKEDKEGVSIELLLANGEVFPQPGEIGAIEGDFDNETGNIAFRADFPNPSGVLRHGQTGTVLIHRKVPNAIVIPQRATYEILAKRYVFVVEPVDKQEDDHGHEAAAEHGGEHGAEHGEASAENRGVVRQREIVIQDELDDVYVIKEGLGVNEKIVFEGVQQVRDGDEVAYEVETSDKILNHLKYAAE